MYSPAVTIRWNEAMKVHKQLRNEDKQIQAYVKFPAILMVTKPGETTYSVRVLGENSYLLEVLYLSFSCLEVRSLIPIARYWTFSSSNSR